ncbi:MAG TPA: flagellar hook-basal body protein [Bacillaceae bacterium]|nr:flagellar hook-basal body protein [Paenibacillus bovis]HLU20937.1 flagellar hook-basal body protein [Bacillaceae bacterium]
MLRGLHTAASGMYAQARKTDMLTNNMANINTPGYKEDQGAIRAFPEMLLHHVNSSNPTTNAREVGSINTGVYMQETLPRFIQGDLRETNKNTDLALTDIAGGTAFFSIENNGEMKYTRNGSFTIDQEGTLTTAEGFPVLDENGERILLTSDQFTVTANGVVEQDGMEIARLGIAVTDNPSALIQEGNGLFRTENNDALPIADDALFSVSQGFIEASNVDPSKAMTDMLTAYRAFEANQKVIQAYDKSMDKAVNEIGRVNG